MAEKGRLSSKIAPAPENATDAPNSPALQSPAVQSPAIQSPAVSSAQESSGPKDVGKTASPALPTSRYYNPAEIKKKAAILLERERSKSKAALGSDIAIPKSAAASSNHTASTNVADNTKVSSSHGKSQVESALQMRSVLMTYTAPSTRDAAPTKITGFGLSKVAANAENNEKSALKAAVNLDEEEVTKKAIEKLPTPPPQDGNTGDATHADAVNQDQDADSPGYLDIADGDDEAEAAAAARAAAEKRALEVTAKQDVEMADAAQPPEPTNTSIDDDKMDESEDVDPLEAFMNGLEAPEDNDVAPVPRKGKQTVPQVYNSDDEGDLDAVDNNPEDILAMAKQKKKQKDIPTVNHGTITYEPFRKSFYSESVELAQMTEEEVKVLRFEMDDIKVRGIDVPKPITKWSQAGLGAQTMDVIRSLHYDTPSSIQSQAIPAIMSGRDVIGVAKTGSGKTVAFLLPMFRHIKDQRPLENLDGPIGIIMAPTRELATQIHRDCKPYLKALNLRAVCAYGGAPISEQIAELKRGAEIVVCTPGRMIDLLAANAGRVTNLRRVTYVVLDEADRMFDMGFEPQITKIINNIRPQRQTVLFSATFPSKMEALARKALQKPVEIVVGGRSVVAAEIEQRVEVRSDESKFFRLLGLLGEITDKDEEARVLIFVEKQETADSMLKELLKKQYPAVSVHGGREQIDRDSAIDDFKSGAIPILIATSVAARGLDVKQLKLVINYDPPNHIEDYVHRAGRTGRAGNTGTAVTFLTPEQDRFAEFLVKALKQSEQEIPKDLQDLLTSFKEKVKAGAARAAGSGFRGKGLEHLESARAEERGRERKLYKTGDDDADEQGDDKKDGKKDGNEAKVEALIAKATGQVKSADEPAALALPSNLASHLEAAMQVNRAATPPTTIGGSAWDKVSAAAAAINGRLGSRGQSKYHHLLFGCSLMEKLGTLRSGVPIDNKGPDAGAYHATLEINDFPQKARWAVTNRTNVAKILDATGASITNKGKMYPADQTPGPGEEPKLYILVEGDTEVVVQSAMTDLVALLQSGTMAAMEADNRAPASGRYSVV